MRDRSSIPGDCHEQTRRRFDKLSTASEYPALFTNTRKDRRERRALLKALEAVPPGASVLDLPCGSGRLTSLLVERGYRVTAADSSAHMVERARQAAPTGAGVRFDVRDVLDSGYPDGCFDAVVCHRLFHHFGEAGLRQRALGELARICRGPVIASFFNAFALDALRSRLKHALRGTRATDRIPIPLATFAADGRLAGLRVERTVAVRFGISPLWLVVFRNADPTRRSLLDSGGAEVTAPRRAWLTASSAGAIEGGHQK